MSDVARRVRSGAGAVLALGEYFARLDEDRLRMTGTVEVKPLAELTEWQAGAERDRIVHRSGKFFAVEGIRVTMPCQQPASWEQPIVVQPEVGVLGILVKRINGTWHALLQNKREPGNRNGVQLSPTVQATRSNYMRVHGGAATPYLSYFRPLADPGPTQRVLADVRHSEQGSWFLRKRNRNVVIEVFDDPPVLPGWYWLTLDQVAELMSHDDLVNMEVRSVLSCLPPALVRELAGPGPEDLRRSLDPSAPTAHPMADVLSWVSRARTDHEQRVEGRSLREIEGWTFDRERLAHDSGRYFTVIGVDVVARGREVRTWDQPMVAAGTAGIVALVVTRIDGVTHVLLRLRAEAGGFDGPEIAPTVQCDPSNYGPGHSPPFLAEVLGAARDDVLFDTMLSDEGGRFFETSHRHLVVRTEDPSEPEGFRWLTLAQCADLARHSHYLNVQVRSLLACMQALALTGPGAAERREDSA